MQFKKDIIKGTIGMLFVFTGNTRKVELSKEVRTGLLEALEAIRVKWVGYRWYKTGRELMILGGIWKKHGGYYTIYKDVKETYMFKNVYSLSSIAEKWKQHKLSSIRD